MVINQTGTSRSIYFIPHTPYMQKRHMHMKKEVRACVCIVCMCARSCESYSRRLLELLSKCLDWTHRDGKSYIVVYCKVVFLPRHFRSFDYTTLASYGSIVKVVIEVRNIATGYLELLIVIYLDLPALMDKIHIACEILCILSWYFEA